MTDYELEVVAKRLLSYDKRLTDPTRVIIAIDSFIAGYKLCNEIRNSREIPCIDTSHLPVPDATTCVDYVPLNATKID